MAIMILFVLGRQPELGLAELNAVFGRPSRLIADQVAVMDIDRDAVVSQVNRLGSIVKIADVCGNIAQLNRPNLDQCIHAIFDDIDGKITLGVSTYGRNVNRNFAIGLGNDIKSVLRRSGNSVRMVPATGPDLSSATVLHNKLAHGNPKKCELIFVRHADGSLLVARTFHIQDINAYAFRDRDRPRRDAHNGMLPPKLAQIMVNLSYGASQHGSQGFNLLDPFCGTGVILQEASLMNMAVYGTDLNPTMVENTKINLDWLDRTHHITTIAKLEAGDATSFNWQNWASPNRINLVATETYLGRPYVVAPAIDELKDNIANCNTVITKFLANLSQQLASGAGLCIGVPCWYVRGKVFHLPVARIVEDLGYQDLYQPRHLIYHRHDQIVGRELLVLQKS